MNSMLILSFQAIAPIRRPQRRSPSGPELRSLHDIPVRPRIDVGVPARLRHEAQKRAVQHRQRHKHEQHLHQQRLRRRTGREVLVHDERKQHHSRQKHEAEIGEVPLQDARHLGIGQRHDHAPDQQHDDDARDGARGALADPQFQDAPRKRQDPQHGQTREDAAERDLLDGLSHIGGVERGRLQVREHARRARRLQEVCEQRRSQAADVPAALRHVVHGEVVIRSEVRERPEARMVVPHDASRHHEIRSGQAGELTRAARREQAPFGDVGPPKQREGQKRQHKQLRTAPRHERHAQRPGQIPPLRSRRRPSLHPEVQAPHRERKPQRDGQRVERRELEQVQHAAAHDERYLQQQVQPQAHAFEVVAGEAVEQRRTAQHEREHGHKHPDGRWEIRSGQQIERQVEQKDRHHAEVHVVMAIVVGHIKKVLLARFLLRLVARPLVVGVAHVLQPLGRLLFEVQLPMRHRLRQFGVLLGVVAAHLEHVHEAHAVPRAAVVVFRRHAHKVRSQEQIRAEQAHLKRHSCDDDRFRATRRIDDADAVDDRARPKRERERQDPQREGKAHRVEVEGMVSVEAQAREPDGIAHLVADDLDAQVLHEAGRVEVDVLALAR